MSNQDQVTEFQYRVVISDEERYSIWPTYKDIPFGWRDGGFAGPKQACLEHISEVWTDMRPLALRRLMDGNAAAQSRQE